MGIPKLSFIGLCALAVALNPAAAPAAPADQLLINGPDYKKIVRMKDLVADILPPPAFIIESYLVVLQMIDEAEQGKSIDALAEYGRVLKEGVSAKGELAGYEERIAVWVKDLPTGTDEEKQLKEWLVTKSYEPAKRFYEIRDTKFIPAVKGGDLTTAKTVARAELKPAYEAHRKAIDEVVNRATAMATKLEKEVAAKAAKGDMTDLQIGGSVYNRIIQLKDVIADVLPPPRYIIESYFVCLQMIDEAEAGADKAGLAKLAETGRQLKAGMSLKKEISGFGERQDFWKASLPEGNDAEKTIKQLMIKTSYEPAMKFYEARDAKFLPAALKGDAAEAKKIAREQLKPLYDTHRKAVDELVAAANAMYTELMKEVETKLKK